MLKAGVIIGCIERKVAEGDLCVLWIMGRETIAGFLLQSSGVRPVGDVIIPEAVGEVWSSHQPSCCPQRSGP